MNFRSRSVALFSSYFPTHGGGMELATDDLARALIAAGLRVKWIAQSDGRLPAEMSGYCVPVPGSDIIYAISGVPMPIPAPWALPGIWSAVREANVVVVVEANFILSAIAFAVAKVLGKPILLVQHVGRPSTVSRLARLVMTLGERIVTRRMVESADAVVCVSRAVARHFAALRNRDARHVIGHGIDMDQFQPPADGAERVAAREQLGLPPTGKVACYVGRLTESKGISVVAEVARLRPDWTFAVAGSGPVRPDRWNLPNVIALGQLCRSDVAALYRAAEAMILPSQSESFSIVVREALAAGCHVHCADQILETDPGLVEFLVTEPVDLADVRGTAGRFAAALDAGPPTKLEHARAYVGETCSNMVVAARYVAIVAGLIRKHQAELS